MTNQASKSLLEERYGRGRAHSFDRRFAWAIAGVAVLVGLVVILFGGWQQTTSVDFQVLHYSVIDESTVEVDMQVTVSTDRPVVCAVEALSSSHGTVGWKLVTVPEDDDRTRRFTRTLVTTAPATSGLVRNCWELDPG